MPVSEDSTTPGADFASDLEVDPEQRRRLGQTDDIDESSESDTGNHTKVSTNYVEDQSEDGAATRTPTYSFCEPSLVAFKVHVYRKVRRTGVDYGTPEEFRRVSVFVDDKPFVARIRETVDHMKGNTSGSKSDTARVHTTTTAFEVITDVLSYGEAQRSYMADLYKDAHSGHHRPRAPDFATLRIKKVSRTHLIITSLVLREALRTLIGYYPRFGSQHNTSLTRSIIHEPYAALMHNYDAITEYADTGTRPLKDDHAIHSKGSVASRDMALLRDFLKPLHETLIMPTITLLAQPVPQITFDMIWYIFSPGTQVYVQSSEEIYAAVVSDTFDSLDRWDSGPIQYITLDLWRLDTDGNRIARTPETQDITSFTGVKDVTSLPTCPVSYWDSFDGGNRRRKILDRSRMHIAALRKGYLHVHYEGPDLTNGTMVKGKMVLDYKRFAPFEQAVIGYNTPIFDAITDVAFSDFLSYDYIFVDEAGSFDRDGKKVPRNSKGRMAQSALERSNRMQRRNVPGGRQDRVDVHGRPGASYRPMDPLAHTYKMLEYRQEPNSARIMDAQMKKLYGTSEISEEQLLLLTPESPAFDLTTKRWHIISTDGVCMVKASDESMSNLILPDNSLQTVRALSSRQQKVAKGWSADFIEGKGSGQIILLHGPPGVGKTYTVESIAEWLQRPLLALTVADIGTTETTVEQELLRWFDLAEAWDAVLLVDEADVFLEQRKNRDLARNSLVTAFLRRMEYFKGLLFLTTNRVGQIDDAFISRVHVTIEYEALSKETRARIWNGFFAKLQRERKGKITVAKRAKEYVLSREISLNGREIRNTLQTAIALASFQANEDKDCPDDEPVIVEEGHFKDVLDMSEKFHKYVASIRREDEAKRANVRGDRNDYRDP